MGYRVGGPWGSLNIGPSSGGASGSKQAKGIEVGEAPDHQRFLSSYAATFSRAGVQPAPPNVLRATMQGALVPSKSLRIAAANALGPGPQSPAAAAASPGGGRPLAKSSSDSSLSLRGAALAGASSSGMAASSSLRSGQGSRGGGGGGGVTALAGKPLSLATASVRTVDREVRRRTLELLADPDLANVAKDIYKSNDTSGNGKLELPELLKVMGTLHSQLDLPEVNEVIAESLFKKYDVNNDKALTFGEFFELFKSSLRRSAFDRSSMLRREFFINRSSDDVWDHYVKKKELGSGTFGTAYLARCKETNEERVVKAVKKSRLNLPLDEIEQEILIMRQVDHPHIVRLFGWYEDAGKFYLVMEALKGGTLKDVVLLLQNQQKGLKEGWIRKVVLQTIEGMAYCHNLRLIHKDLKDENIMLLRKDPNFEEPFAVIIDLGIAEMFSVADPSGREMGGTPMTMAPEVWLGNFGPKCDVWSIGVILYEMLAGAYPFMANSCTAAAWTKQHKRGPDWSKMKSSGPGKALCKAMLTYTEAERPSMRQCCEHQWFAMDHQELQLIPATKFAPFAAFCKQQQVRRSLLLEIASRLPMEKAYEVVDIFKSLDVNRDGTLSPAELHTFFQSMGINDKELADNTFKALDADQDGSLTFTEFASGALLLFQDKLEESLLALFQTHDPNGDGALDRNEAKRFLDAAIAAVTLRGGHSSSEALIDRLLKGGASGKISFAQLRDYLLEPVGATPASSARSSRRSAR